jgi:hypothetical protein
MEYHCYNGFDPIVTAFQKAALIFGAGDCQSVFSNIRRGSYALIWVSAVTTGANVLRKFVGSPRTG